MHLTIKRRVWGISMEDFGVLCVWEFYGNSVGIPTVFFSVGMGWVWELKFNSHGITLHNLFIFGFYAKKVLGFSNDNSDVT